MHFILRTFLAFLAKIIIKIKKPFIIGVTGTAGKTTISRFIITFLEEEFGKGSVQFSEYNYNGEYGMPLAIIGARSGGKNIFSWIKIIFISLRKIIKPYPKFLVLEYGIDHPGEMDFLLSIAKPHIAIISPISPNHIEQFGRFEKYREEKLKIFRAEKVIMHDSLQKFSKKSHILYGKNLNSDFSLIKTITTEQGTENIFKYKDKEYHFCLPLFGEFQSENILSIFALAHELKIPFEDIKKMSHKFLPEAGRNRIFQGVNNSIIIDGSYNGGPFSITEGLLSLVPFLPHNKIFLFLGDMRELGALEKEKHEEVAHKIIKIFEEYHQNIQIFLVGPMTKKYMQGILKEQFITTHSLSSKQMGGILKKAIESENQKVVVFAKGSQNTIFLEEGIKFLIQEKEHIHLCRQSGEWIEKKEKFFANIK